MCLCQKQQFEVLAQDLPSDLDISLWSMVAPIPRMWKWLALSALYKQSANGLLVTVASTQCFANGLLVALGSTYSAWSSWSSHAWFVLFGNFVDWPSVWPRALGTKYCKNATATTVQAADLPRVPEAHGHHLSQLSTRVLPIQVVCAICEQAMDPAVKAELAKVKDEPIPINSKWTKLKAIMLKHGLAWVTTEAPSQILCHPSNRAGIMLNQHDATTKGPES